jgi:ParB family transcriptional regulator, chromosome partitioning protein
MSMDFVDIPIQLIDEDTDQPRYQFDEESLQELMQSISELGLLSPIKVRTIPGNRYKIIYGNRRYKACRMLKLTTIPCIVSTVTDEQEIYLEQIAENLNREGFTPIEEADAFYKLLNDPRFTSSTKFLSSKLGKPESYIKNKLELLKFGNAVRKLVISGTEIKTGKLTEEQLLPLKDLAMEHRDPLALIIAKDGMPVSDAKKIASLFKDTSISSGTKDKLLFKSGPELIETWSVFRNNKLEREKRAKEAEKAKEEQAAKAAQETKEAQEAESHQEETARNKRAVSGEAERVDDTDAVKGKDAVQTIPTSEAVTVSAFTTQPLKLALKRIHDLAAKLEQLDDQLDEDGQQSILNEVNEIIGGLEKRLELWLRN